MTTTSREPDFWDSRIGPFLDASGLQQLTGLDRREIDARVAAGEILEVITSDQAHLYPSFQTSAGGGLLPGLAEVMGCLAEISDDRWDVALWLLEPSSRFNGLCAADILRAGDIARVVEAAERDARVLKN